jgi:hypothetical protein
MDLLGAIPDPGRRLPPRDAAGRFTAADPDAGDGQDRAAPATTAAFDGGARPMPPRPADPVAAHAQVIIALARPRSVGPFVG